MANDYVGLTPDGVPITYSTTHDPSQQYQMRLTMKGDRLLAEVGVEYQHMGVFGPEEDNEAVLREMGVRMAIKALVLAGASEKLAFVAVRTLIDGLDQFEGAVKEASSG